MKIALLERWGVHKAGEVIDLPVKEAERLINTGNATIVDQAKEKAGNKPGAKAASVKRSTK